MRYILQKQFYNALWGDRYVYDSTFTAGFGFDYETRRLEEGEKIRLLVVIEEAKGT